MSELATLLTFAQARAELWMAIAHGVDLGLNPPEGMRDHETDGVFHALLFVQCREDVWPWARHFGEPVSVGWRHEPLTEPEVREYPKHGRRETRAVVLLAANREVTVTYGEDIQKSDGSQS